MKIDYLIESADSNTFVLVSRDRDGQDGSMGLATAAKSERLQGLLSELGLEEGFLSQFAAQIALTNSVDKDLLIEEGKTIEEELTLVYEHIKRIELDEDGWDDDMTLQGENIPEQEVIWAAMSGMFGVGVLDRKGRSDIGTFPFSIEQPVTPDGSFIRFYNIDWIMLGVLNAVKRVKGLNPNDVTCFTDQYAVTYDREGKPIAVDEVPHIGVGNIDKHSEFKPFATLLTPFEDED
ncbi:hypothetical protein H7171_03810 [Candidatus Saccharibacteria bacterium]|nr:hypothetical protein [Candidatus Saccharibacteria bacterium]